MIVECHTLGKRKRRRDLSRPHHGHDGQILVIFEDGKSAIDEGEENGEEDESKPLSPIYVIARAFGRALPARSNLLASRKLLCQEEHPQSTRRNNI